MALHLQIIQGSIFDQHVQALVCSANNWLRLGSGIAGEIKEKGGPQVQEECYDLITKNNDQPLNIGDATITSSGNLHKGTHHTHVIHAVGMGYGNLKENHIILESRIHATKESVYQAVYNSLKVANENGLESIAFPLMCSRPGYHVYEPNEAPKVMLQAMIQAVQDFDKTNNLLKTIVICVPNPVLEEYGKGLIK